MTSQVSCAMVDALFDEAIADCTGFCGMYGRAEACSTAAWYRVGTQRAVKGAEIVSGGLVQHKSADGSRRVLAPPGAPVDR